MKKLIAILLTSTLVILLAVGILLVGVPSVPSEQVYAKPGVIRVEQARGGTEEDIIRAIAKLPMVSNYRGGKIDFSPGVYEISNTILVDREYQGITFQGASRTATIFKLAASVDMFVFENVTGVTFRDIAFMNPFASYPERGSNVGSAIIFGGGSRPIIDQCFFFGLVGSAIKFEGPVVAPRIMGSYIGLCGDADRELAAVHYVAGEDRINDIANIINTELGCSHWRAIYADSRTTYLTLSTCYIETGHVLMPTTPMWLETYCRVIIDACAFVDVGSTVIINGVEVDMRSLDGNNIIVY